MDIFSRVKSLALPVGEYVVFGSGPLEAHGIRKVGDVDLFVTSKLYDHLKLSGWPEKTWAKGGDYLERDNIEIDKTWNFGAHNPTAEEIIKIAEVINGVPFAPLQEVLKYKREYDRPKDRADIKLIEEHLKTLNN